MDKFLSWSLLTLEYKESPAIIYFCVGVHSFDNFFIRIINETKINHIQCYMILYVGMFNE